MPKEGGREIARSISRTIEKNGGSILLNSEVTQILIDPKKKSAIGVQLKNQQKIFAKKIISALNPLETFQFLISEPKSFFPSLQKEISSETVERFVKIFGGFIFSGNEEKLEISSPNFVFIPSPDNEKENDVFLSQIGAEFDANPFSDFQPVYSISFPTMKINQQNDVILCHFVTEVKASWIYGQLRNNNSNECDEEKISEVKDKFYKIFTTVLAAKFPSINDHLMEGKIAFNFSNLHQKDFDFRFKDELFPETSIPNLFLSNVQVGMNSFNGAVKAGLLCANKVLGYGNAKDLIIKRDLLKDIHNLNNQLDINKKKDN